MTDDTGDRSRGGDMDGYSGASLAEGPLAEVPAVGLRRVWMWAALIAVGGFLFGFDTG